MISWLFFFAGQLLNTWLRASIIIKLPSSVNRIATSFQYICHYRQPLLIRLFGATSLYMLIFYGGGALMGDAVVEKISTLPWVAKAGASGLFGLGADAFLDKVMAKWFPGSIPPAPTGGTICE